jgi:hypothetical protein
MGRAGFSSEKPPLDRTRGKPKGKKSLLFSLLTGISLQRRRSLQTASTAIESIGIVRSP